MLSREIFQALQVRFPNIRVDLFADRLNTQLPRYWSWRPDPYAEGVHALTVVWRGMNAYVFPPFRLIHRILRKLVFEKASILLIAPVWPNQPWYPILLKMLTEQPVLLPQPDHLLTAPDGSTHPMCQEHKMVLAAWPVSGDPEVIPCCQAEQEPLQTWPGVQALIKPMTPVGANSLAGVVDSKPILFRALWS